jgi:RNA polymerase sigma-70 factor (ECF subfamily)
MAEETYSTMRIQLRLDRLRAGDASARDELLTMACERLRRLARKMLRGYPGVRRWEQTDDVLQNAAVRLCRALEAVHPASVRDFINLAAVQVRRELIDLARHYDGPEGAGRGKTGRNGHESLIPYSGA